jgi:hypothetical protein
MIKTNLLFLLVVLFSSGILAQTELNYYFPDNPKFDPAIPVLEDIIGFEIGEKHVSHDQLVKYMYILAEKSNRINIERYGWTYEHRPLLLLTISSPENLVEIENIRLDHLKLSDPLVSGDQDITGMPSVIWLGYSVHGNEPSGLNASLLVAYYLAAAESDEVKNILNNTIILIDPSINPDGYSRFEQWVNQYKSHVRITDPNNIEHNEAWPGGRTNHYWFDLNRDWLPLQHPESKARIHQFYKWKPIILSDHHEMGSNSTFFFQPGISSRINPNTPPENDQLTSKIANYHATALDNIGTLYYSKEVYDDFYYGKGSSYPDVNGGIGILFEQASSRAHARQTDNGILTFPYTIRNQLTVSLSTIKAGFELKNELLKYQVNFYNNAVEMAEKDADKAYVISCGSDKTRMRYFLEILNKHQIETYELAREVSSADYTYKPGSSFIVPMEQKQHRLIKAVFEKSTSFTDSLFYDVSAWTFPLAFDMNYTLLAGKSYSPELLGVKLNEMPNINGSINSESIYAYLMNWDDYYAPKALNMLFMNNLKVKVSIMPFTTQDGEFFEAGTLLIPVQNQPVPHNKIYEILRKISEACYVDFCGVSTGFNSDGIDLGSPNMLPLEKPSIMMLVGDGISSYEAGEVWHLLDYRFQIPVSLIDIGQFNKMNINRYTTLILVNGQYTGISAEANQKLTSWLKNGGEIIAIKNGAKWLIDQNLANISLKKVESDTLTQRNYGDMNKYIGSQRIGGSIFEANLDLTHPLCFGYEDNQISIFKNSKLFFERSKNPYNNPVVFTEDPLQSGYISETNYELIKNASGLIVSSIGRGKTICFSENPNFRAFWLGTNRLFFNALFFGKIIENTSAR